MLTMNRLMIAAQLLLTGCSTAMAPRELLERGERRDVSSAQLPDDFVACLARNAEKQGDLYDTIVRPIDWDALELVVRRGYTGVVVRAYPKQDGSQATGWIFPTWRTLWPAMIEGC